MKKLLYMGLSALMMLLALMGVGKAQEVTFSPASGTTVPDGQEITLTKTGGILMFYGIYASREEAEQTTAFTGDYYDAEQAKLITEYSASKKPVITTGKTVIRVGITQISGDWLKTDIYAEYTIGESGPTVTFSPDPADGDVTVGQEITITATGAQSNSSIYYNMYSTMEEATNATAFTAVDDFWDVASTIRQYNANNKPVIEEGKPVIRVGIRAISGQWEGSNYYATYTIGEGETEEKVETPTFSPVAGAVVPGTTVTINCNTEGASIYYTTDGSTPDENSTSYSTPITINKDTTIKAIAIKDGMANSTVAEATFSLVSVNVTFSPDSGSVVQENAKVTVSGTHNVAQGYFYWKAYASLEAAQAETWSPDAGDLYDANIAMAFNKGGSKELTITNAKPVIKIGALYKAGSTYNVDTWSEMFYAKYIVATKPVFSASGEVEAGTVVTISAFEGASIYYTIDGTTPSASSTPYTTGITINEPVTINAIAIRDGVSSAMNSASFTIAEAPITVDTPTFSHPTGEVAKGTSITISCETPEATIRYTTDGTEPHFASTLYENPIVINQTTTIKAIALKGGQISSVVERTYTVKEEEPETVTLTLDPADGSTIYNGDEISITCSNSDCDIIYAYYASREEAEADTIWAKYGETGTINDIMFDYSYGRNKPTPTVGKNVLRVGAWLYEKSSFVATAYAEYTIEEKPIVLTFTPASGAEVEEGDTVKIECSNEETVVYFMMFDTKANAEAFDEGKWEEAIADDVVLIYPEEDDEFAVYPVITKEKPVIKVGYATPDEEDQDKTIWNFIYAVYTVKEETPDPDKVAAPVFTPEAGAVDSNTVVTIAKGAADSIFVAFGKTVAEAVAFAKYTADVTVTIVKDTVIRAYAMKDGKYSDTIDRAYTLKPAATVQDTVETPIFSVEGEVEKGTKVTISCTTTGAKIYYTVNGDVPTAQSTEYTAQIVIDSAMTIKAIAVKEGSVDSKVAEASYTIKKVANEGAELAGVRLYPNPNNGEFNVSVPVRVQVEVFTVNGMLVKDMTIAQGNTQIRLENSGIYFVRFTAENGQAAVKRVIVR